MYQTIIDIVGTPLSAWQENCAYLAGCVLLLLGIWAIFKIINYLYHI